MYDLTGLDNAMYNELTVLWNNCWGASSPREMGHLQLNPQFLKAYIDINLISLPNSIGLTSGGKLIGYSYMAAYGQSGWIAALGIDPYYRGKGLAKVLLNSQLLIAQKLKIQQITLEVSPQNHASRVYHGCGFKYWRKLNSFTLPSKQASSSTLTPSALSTISSSGYDSVENEIYFSSRSEICDPFSWRRKDFIISRYPNLKYYVSKSQSSGYALTNNRVIDIWAGSRSEARRVLALIQMNMDNTIIHHQINDWVSIFLMENDVKPSTVQYEMKLSL